MKKLIPAIMMLLLLLIPDVSAAAYLILLRNGRQVVTTAYWFEGTRILFYTIGGIAGMERSEITGVESMGTENELNSFIVNKGKKEKVLPPAFSSTQKTQEQSQPSQTKGEQIDLTSLKQTKDQMMAELDDLLDKLREATNRKDTDAKEKLREEIRAKSGQIYRLTDEVTEKNRGRLPEGWWGK